jgi:hypothetical protein
VGRTMYIKNWRVCWHVGARRITQRLGEEFVGGLYILY